MSGNSSGATVRARTAILAWMVMIEFRVAVAARVDDLPRGAFRRDARQRQRIRDRKPAYSCGRCPLNIALTGEPGPHQPGKHRRDDDVVARPAPRAALPTARRARTCWRSTARRCGTAILPPIDEMLTMRPAPWRRMCGSAAIDHVERPPEMRRHRIFVVGELHVIERADLDDAGVVDQHVDARRTARPPGRSRRSASCAARTSAGDRQHLGERLARLDVVGRALQLLFVAGDQREPGAFVGQLARQDEAQSARPAGDDDRLAGESYGSRRRHACAAARRPDADRADMRAPVSAVQLMLPWIVASVRSAACRNGPSPV